MQCEMRYGTDLNCLNVERCHREAVRECDDCGKKLCREDATLCCDQYWCQFCIDLHQTTPHFPVEVKLRTEHVFPPIPIRSCDWCAYDENTYDGAPDAGHQIVGYGSTEHEAIADFREQLLEDL